MIERKPDLLVRMKQMKQGSKKSELKFDSVFLDLKLPKSRIEDIYRTYLNERNPEIRESLKLRLKELLRARVEALAKKKEYLDYLSSEGHFNSDEKRNVDLEIQRLRQIYDSISRSFK